MKKIRLPFCFIVFFACFSAFAQHADTILENNIISLEGKKGISWQTPAGDFIFKPYVLVQSTAVMKYYDDEGLNLADKHHINNSGFGIPFAMLGFSGRAFQRVTFNLALNAASGGSALLNQAWFDIKVKEGIQFTVGKFKTPFNNAYLTRIGETLFPVLPGSLSATVYVPVDINSVNPVIATGFDLGVEMHGAISKKWYYQLGLFNGTGIGVNEPTRYISEDVHIPSLLYSGRLAFSPHGVEPLNQSDPDNLKSTKFMIALSASYNAGANNESSNDLRSGIEFLYQRNRFFFSSEAYMLNMDFVEKQQVSRQYLFWGGYFQGAYFISRKIQPALRLDVYDRNSNATDGLLYMPAAGMNYYVMGQNLKFQAMYQLLGKYGHEDKFSANDDDNGMSEHMVTMLLQFSF